jgi:hypothetical protein
VHSSMKQSGLIEHQPRGSAAATLCHSAVSLPHVQNTCHSVSLSGMKPTHPALDAAAFMLQRTSHECVTRVDEDKCMPDTQADRPAHGLLLLARDVSRTHAPTPSTRFHSRARCACMQMQSGVTEQCQHCAPQQLSCACRCLLEAPDVMGASAGLWDGLEARREQADQQVKAAHCHPLVHAAAATCCSVPGASAPT